MAGLTTSQPVADVEGAVTRPLWEPRHEWEARVKFVEDNVADHDLEKAVNLSLVWANMKFLGCRYPAGTEAMVSDYPEPSYKELRARRKCKDSVANFKRRSSKDGHSASFEEVSALLSSIHTQSSIKATPLQLQAIANKLCLCKECLEVTETDSYSNKGVKILEQLKGTWKDFNYELINLNEVWSLVINSEVVLNGCTTKISALENFVKMLNNWQEANQKPACPKVASQQPSSGFQSNEPGFGLQSTGSPNSSYEDQRSYGGRGRGWQQGNYYQQGSNWSGGRRGGAYSRGSY